MKQMVQLRVVAADSAVRGKPEELCETFIYHTAIFGVYDSAKHRTQVELFGLQSRVYRLAVIEVNDAVKQPVNRQFFTRRFLQGHLQAQLGRICRFYLADYQPGSFLLLLCYEEEAGLLGQAEAAFSQLRQQLGGLVAVGVSAPFGQFFEVTSALQQAQHALEMKFYAERGLMFLYKSATLCIFPSETIRSQHFEDIRHSVVNGHPEQFVQYMEAFSQELVAKYQGTPGGADECRKLSIELAALLLSEVQKAALSASYVLGSSFPYVPILYADGIQNIKSILLDLGLHCIQQMEAMQPQHADHTVATIMAYLSRNYAEKISLNQVAEQVFMNASYVSRLLKKATGKTFTDLLLAVRIEKAKKLLRGATKVYEVGELVGIDNPKYFSQIFKKHTGATPSAFRGANMSGIRIAE